MRSALRDLHEEVLTLLGALQRETDRQTLEPSTLASLARVRWRLSGASHRRHALLEHEVFPYLLTRCSQAEGIAIADLGKSGAVLRRVSGEHVSNWTIERVQADWAGYRTASAQMRATMRRRIAHERAVLEPFFERYPAPARAIPPATGPVLHSASDRPALPATPIVGNLH